MTESCYQIAATFLTRSFVIVSRTFPLRFLIWEETKSLSTGFGGEEAWGNKKKGKREKGEGGRGRWVEGGRERWVEGGRGRWVEGGRRRWVEGGQEKMGGGGGKKGRRRGRGGQKDEQ